LRPVTIKQINDAQDGHGDGEFKIDGTKITQLTFVGQIRNISTQTTHVTYKLDDGTGTIEVKQWTDSDASMDEGDSAKPQLKENGYARVWGKIKSFSNKRHVGAHMIRPIMDYNEVLYHMLESTAVHLFFTKGPLETAAPKAAAGNSSYGMQANTYGGAQNGAMDGTAGLSMTAKKVYNIMKTTPQTNEGLHIQDIASRLRMDTAEVARAGDDLLSNGMIYTTVDESTWAILEI
jgi:replication factor A2